MAVQQESPTQPPITDLRERSAVGTPLPHCPAAQSAGDRATSDATTRTIDAAAGAAGASEPLDNQTARRPGTRLAERLRAQPSTGHYDAIVLGGGMAGVPLALRLGYKGLRTALVERAELGGTCLNRGCIPTKTMIASARVAHQAFLSEQWGVALATCAWISAGSWTARTSL